jgi:hypothetical protein
MKILEEQRYTGNIWHSISAKYICHFNTQLIPMYENVTEILEFVDRFRPKVSGSTF